MASEVWIESPIKLQLNDYKILSVIGKGSSGVVYKAVPVKGDIDKVYAIKKVQI